MDFSRVRGGRFFGFVLAGGAATVVNYSIFSMLLLSGVHYLLSSGIGYVSGIVVSFSINRRYVFRSSGDTRSQLTRYMFIYAGALIAQLGLLELLVRAGIIPLIANAIALFVVVTANYFVIKRFVFS